MGDGQTLLERCLLLPSDDTARGVFADWLDENSEPELGAAIRGERGAEYLEELRYESNRIARFPCLKFLWAVVFVLKADHARLYDVTVNLRPGSMLTLPNDWNSVPAGRPGFFRRLFGK